MTIEEFDKKVTATLDQYLVQAKELTDGLKNALDAIREDAKDLPEHLVLAVLKNGSHRMMEEVLKL